MLDIRVQQDLQFFIYGLPVKYQTLCLFVTKNFQEKLWIYAVSAKYFYWNNFTRWYRHQASAPWKSTSIRVCWIKVIQTYNLMSIARDGNVVCQCRLSSDWLNEMHVGILGFGGWGLIKNRIHWLTSTKAAQITLQTPQAQHCCTNTKAWDERQKKGCCVLCLYN